MARFRKKSRRVYAGAKKHYTRHKGMGGGTIGKAISGFLVGAGVVIARPYINKYVPAVGPFGPTTIVTGLGGAGCKYILKKDPMGLATAATIIGSGMAASDLLVGPSTGAGAGTGGETAF